MWIVELFILQIKPSIFFLLAYKLLSIYMYLCTYLHITTYRLEVADQFLTLFIELFYEKLGSEKVFTIWWSFHLFFLINVYITANVYIFYDSRKIFPDLASGSINISFVKMYRIVIPFHPPNAINTNTETIGGMNPEQPEASQELFKRRRTLIRETTMISKTLEIEMEDLD